jgi:galactokinase
MDKLPQRVLVHKLKRAIDQIPRDRQAVTRVQHLVDENPRSARSTHVLRNLGASRVATLGDLLGEPLARPRAGGSAESDRP